MDALMKVGGGLGDSVMKAADSIEEKYFVWTTVWTLPSLGAGLDRSVPPILWMRHDRPNETVNMFLNDDQVYYRLGAGSRRVKPTDRFGGEVETIEFTAAGQPCRMEIVYEPTKLKKFGSIGRAVAGDKIQYHLSVNDVKMEPDTEGSGSRLPPPGQSGLHQRVSIPEWRQVSKRPAGGDRAGMDWQAETVVEYAIHMSPTAEAAAAGQSKLVRWARYSEFRLLHSDICSCFATVKEGAALPKLPKKTWSMSSSQKGEAFKTERQDALQAYLRALLQTHRGPYNPYLLLFLGVFSMQKYLSAADGSVVRKSVSVRSGADEATLAGSSSLGMPPSTPPPHPSTAAAATVVEPEPAPEPARDVDSALASVPLDDDELDDAI